MLLLSVYVSFYLFLSAMASDPGAVPKDARPLPSDDQEYDPESVDR